MPNDYAIIADGDFLVREIILEAIQHKTIIALDRAADKLQRLGISPHIIFGDFDEGIPVTVNTETLTIQQENQQLTDLIKAIRYCDEQHAASIVILCAVGGRLDHHEGTMRSLRSEYKKERPMLLHTEQQTIRFAKDEVVTMHGETGDKCGIFAFPKGSLSSRGLFYDVQDYLLQFAYSESIANSLRQSEAILDITGEALLIMPPQLPAQRRYMEKSEIERLELHLRDAKA